jgi:hypothetical protein
MKRLTFLFTLLFGIHVLSAQNSATYESIVQIKPVNGKGLEGDVTIVYAFSECFGDVVLAYGFKNLNLIAYHRNGKRYTENQLGVSFTNNKYVQTTSLSRLELNILNRNVFDQSVNISTILPNYDVGCYGQTKKIGNTEKYDINQLQAVFLQAFVTAKYSLVHKIEIFEKNKGNSEKFKNLMNKANNETDKKLKLSYLQEAKRYASSEEMGKVEKSISVLELKIKEEEIDAETSNEGGLVNEDRSDESQDQSSSVQNRRTSTDQSKYTERPPARKPKDISSNRNKAFGVGVGAAALMASNAQRFGVGLDYTFGLDYSSVSPGLYFKFNEDEGGYVSFGIDVTSLEHENSTREAFDLKIGYFSGYVGMDLIYAEFSEYIVDDYYPTRIREGSQLNLGFFLNLDFLKLGYSYPISSEGTIYSLDDYEEEVFEPYGIWSLGLIVLF